MPKILRIAVVILVLTSAVTAVLLVRERSSRLPASTPPGDLLTPPDHVKGLVIPDFELTTSEGAKITDDAFKSRFTVVDFFFTHCPFICPTLTSKMGELAVALKDVPQVRLLSISVDPEHDTPKRLAEYAHEHRVNIDQWTFATLHGQPDAAEQLQRIVTQGLKFDLGHDATNPINLPDIAGGGQMSNIRHPPFFVIVGPRGEVLDVFPATIPGEIEGAIDRIKAAAKKLPGK